MRPAVRLGLRLGFGPSRAERWRTVSVVIAVLLGTAVLLDTAAVARAEQALHPGAYADPDNLRLLGAVVAAILLPVLVLAATVGRLSAALRDRRMANLRLLGMTRSAVRTVAAVEAGVAATAGALLGVVAFLFLRVPLADVHVAGRGWPAATLWPPAWVYVAVVVLLPAVVVGVAAVPSRLRMVDALARAHLADDRRPARWRTLPLLAGAALCGYVVASPDQAAEGSDRIVLAFFVGVVLLGVGLILVVPVFVRLLADATLRWSRRPVLVVAARRLQTQPVGVTRVVSGLLIGLFLVVGARAVVVSFESTPQYVAADRQVHVRQTVTIQESARRTPHLVQRLRDLPGVEDVMALPQLASRCRAADPCITALVATCAQLRILAPGVGGCRGGRSYFLTRPYRDDPSSATLPPLGVQDLRQEQVRRGTVVLPAPSARLEVSDDVLNMVYADVLLPPTLPAIQPLLATAPRTVIVTAPPGRDLVDRLSGLGVGVTTAADFDDYDFVARLRTLVWSIAAVILAVGLLAFGVAAVDRAVTRRREVVALQLVGVPRSVLRRTQWVEAAAPLVIGCCSAIGLGLYAGATYLTFGGDTSQRGVPWGSSLVLAAFAAAGAVLVGGLTVVAASPRIAPELIRRE
ncbi:MAG: FtsX-like permease family protein [Marmoricola sp.]